MATDGDDKKLLECEEFLTSDPIIAEINFFSKFLDLGVGQSLAFDMSSLG